VERPQLWLDVGWMKSRRIYVPISSKLERSLRKAIWARLFGRIWNGICTAIDRKRRSREALDDETHDGGFESFDWQVLGCAWGNGAGDVRWFVGGYGWRV
jgi:hypothetical protein